MFLLSALVKWKRMFARSRGIRDVGKRRFPLKQDKKSKRFFSACKLVTLDLFTSRDLMHTE